MEVKEKSHYIFLDFSIKKVARFIPSGNIADLPIRQKHP